MTLATTTLFAQSGAPDAGSESLAKKLQNPVADLISVPVESNWEFSKGPARATDYYGNLKPVIPFHLGADWDLITRAILPFSYSVLLDRGSSSRVGVGDAIATVYFSRSKPIRGWFWGIGRPPLDGAARGLGEPDSQAE
jgi:hypothetical protein